MDLFATDMAKLDFLLEADAELALAGLDAEAAQRVLAEEAEGAEGKKRPKYVATYVGSKQKLVDWIWRSTPEGVKSVLDAFSGSAVVAYMYKTKGLRVVANDRLRYAWHTARAIIENKSVTLSDDEIKALVADNPKAGDFVQRTFKGIYFSAGIHKVIDHIRANIDALSGFRKDIALFAVGKTCITGSFGHFSSTTEAAKRKYTPEQFKRRFADTVRRVNTLVFDNGQACTALNKDVQKALAEAKVDLAYFDPPYATQFSTTNYERIYHFIEGLMTYWDGLEIDESNKIRNYKSDHPTVTKTNAATFFDGFLGAAEHIPHWIISYRDKAYPSEREMKTLVAGHGRTVRMRSKDHEYMITNVHGDASHAKERLFICQRAKAQKAAAALAGEELYADALHAEAIWEETQTEIRYRVRPPEHFRKDTFRRKALKGVEGVAIVIAKYRPEHLPEGHDGDAFDIQSFRFLRKTSENPDGWTMAKAKRWIEEHEEEIRAEVGSRKSESDEDGGVNATLAIAGQTEDQDDHVLTVSGEFDLDVLEAIAAQEKVPRVTGFMGSKHFIMGWIDKQVPTDAKSLFDAFAGGCNVAYYYKRKGLKVYANDLLSFPYHLARAVIENSTETLSADEVEALFETNPQAGTFCADHFHGYYFTKPILAWLDNTWANIQRLKGYKKDIALAALGNTCKAKARFGQFSRSKKGMRGRLSDDHERAKHTQIGNMPLSEFTETFRRTVRQLNRLVFDSGQECRAFNADVQEVIPKVKADVLYCDPPYVTQFGANDYESDLHFVEGLMTMWKGKTLTEDTRRSFKSRTRYTKAGMKEMFGSFIAAARRNYGTLVISYRDKAFPTQDEIKGMLAEGFKTVQVNAIDVQYGIVPYEAKRGGKFAKELLFVASGPKALSAAASEGDPGPPIHTSVPVEIAFHDEETPSAQAINVGETPSGDKEFSFILCHVGTNKNGDRFTRDELEGRHQTAVNRKIDLKHSQDFRDIVGGIVASEFVDDESGGHVECIGELYVADNENARLAYKLMKKGILKQVSMECDYAEGECSICGKRVKGAQRAGRSDRLPAPRGALRILADEPHGSPTGDGSWTPRPSAAGGLLALDRRPQMQGCCGKHQPKPVVVVPVLRMVPVAIGRAEIPRIVVPGAAAQHAVLASEPHPPATAGIGSANAAAGQPISRGPRGRPTNAP
jgi:adenine-specific DNA methylase